MEAKLIVYYDGLCKLCSAEIEHYKKIDQGKRIHFQDIFAVGFSSKKEGLDPVRVHKYMQAKLESGKVIEGLDTFIAIWQRIPKYNFMAKMAQLPGIHQVMKLGYHSFTLIRPYLPKKAKADCSDSPLCDIKE